MKLDKREIKEITVKLLDWIKMSMENAGGKRAVIGISGGKDSSVVAALCVKALGKENVLGVLMPDGVQEDISYAEDLCSFLDIKCTTVNIEKISSSFIDSFKDIDKSLIEEVSDQSRLNMPPRIRMTLLYAISQSIEDAMVINTSNISEDWIGYATVYGDTAGAFSPLGMLTSDEVIQIGEFLGLPGKFIFKVPSDGLTGETDEEIFGFSYDILNRYIRGGQIEDRSIKDKIDRMNKFSRFKFLTIPMFNPNLSIKARDEGEVYKDK